MSNKLKKKPSTKLSPETMTAAEVSGITGVKLEILRKWVDRMQRNLSEAYQKEAQEKLLKAEDCISAANVVCIPAGDELSERPIAGEQCGYRKTPAGTGQKVP